MASTPVSSSRATCCVTRASSIGSTPNTISCRMSSRSLLRSSRCAHGEAQAFICATTLVLRSFECTPTSAAHSDPRTRSRVQRVDARLGVLTRLSTYPGGAEARREDLPGAPGGSQFLARRVDWWRHQRTPGRAARGSAQAAAQVGPSLSFHRDLQFGNHDLGRRTPAFHAVVFQAIQVSPDAGACVRRPFLCRITPTHDSHSRIRNACRHTSVSSGASRSYRGSATSPRWSPTSSRAYASPIST